MTDISDADPPAAGTNLPEYSVSEVSQAVKRTLESTFDRVRIRGEISGFKRAASGHLYMALKDDKAVLDGVCWRGVAGKLGLRPEDGMEVIVSGRITSYPGRSKYQIVIDAMELAGEGALLKLLEDRRRKLMAEGLFAAERKRPLPYLPQVIGVVTSPTGAVIRDILHRLADRFPRHVLVWPVLVQGEGAAEQIAAAIAGFNRLGTAESSGAPRPDVLIVARGGGSLEDLWAFNEEVVVRAAAASEIPLISAVGHETDTTLIDFASDRRAPTPTAAAEMAVPVRRDLLAELAELERRMLAAGGRLLDERRTLVEGLGRGLPEPKRLIEEMSQRLDERGERLANAMQSHLQGLTAEVGRLQAALPHPRQQLNFAKERLAAEADRLGGVGRRALRSADEDLARLDAGRRLRDFCGRALGDARGELEALARVLDSVSYQNVLQRGFAVVRGPDGLVAGAAAVTPGLALDIEFGDGHAAAVGVGAGGGAKSAAPRAPARPKRKPDDGSQGSLL